MDIRRLDLDVAIYRDRVQVTDRATGRFVDQRADYAFSTPTNLIAEPRYLEDALVKAIRQMLQGGFSLGQSIAHVVGSELPLSPTQRKLVEAALRETGMSEIVFET
ncbi:MAG: hypothetical protein R3E14_08870 [Erythrobacter sp.]